MATGLGFEAPQFTEFSKSQFQSAFNFFLTLYVKEASDNGTGYCPVNARLFHISFARFNKEVAHLLADIFIHIFQLKPVQ